MKLDFSEIADWKEFEDLAAEYFRSVQKVPENNVTEVLVQPSGEGSDGGRDILVTFRVFDSILIYERKWVIQCKFYHRAVAKKELSTINIPSLIHEYGADGYLLVCKTNVTAKVSEMFENLTRNCRFSYSYSIWEGNFFIKKLMANEQLIEQYFPEYNEIKRKI
jgi:Restriction endonuclease